MTDADAEKGRWNLKLSLDLDETATWGELRVFVQTCRVIPDSQRLGIDYSENQEIEAIYGYVPVENDPG